MHVDGALKEHDQLLVVDAVAVLAATDHGDNLSVMGWSWANLWRFNQDNLNHKWCCWFLYHIQV